MKAGNIQPFDLFRHFSPERIVNVLTLFYGQSLFMFVQLRSPDPPSHLIPPIPQAPGSAAGNDVAASNMTIWPLHL